MTELREAIVLETQVTLNRHMVELPDGAWIIKLKDFEVITTELADSLIQLLDEKGCVMKDEEQTLPITGNFRMLAKDELKNANFFRVRRLAE